MTMEEQTTQEFELSLQTILAYVEQANPLLVQWAVEKAKNDLLQQQLFEATHHHGSEQSDDEEKSTENTK